MSKMVEAKYRDDPNGDDGILLTDNIPHNSELTTIGTGGNVNSREGNEVQVTGIYMSFTCAPHNTTPDPTTNVRYIRIVLYSKRSLSAPFLDVTPTEVINKDVYVIWVDKMAQVPFNSPGVSAIMKVRKKWKPYMKAIYDGASSTAITKNAVFLHLSTDAPNPELVEFSYQLRLFFRDL